MTHLAAHHLIEAINPTLAAVVKRQLASTQEGHEFNDINGASHHEEEAAEYELGNVVGKVLALLSQVHKSQEVHAFLCDLCEYSNVPVFTFLVFTSNLTVPIGH